MTLSDRELLALTLYGEARDQTIDGRIAVGHVILNRSKARFQSVSIVCLAPKQFSCWNADGSANHRTVVEASAQLERSGVLDPLLRECLFLSQGLIGGAFIDRTDGADHYLTTKLFQSPTRPSWASAMRVTAIVGAHTFLRAA